MKLYLFSTFIVFTSFAFSQTRGAAVFPDGDTIKFSYQEDPLKIPKYHVGFSPFGPGFEEIGYKMQFVYRTNGDLSFRAKGTGFYELIKSYEIGRKLNLDVRGVAEYKILSNVKERPKRTGIKAGDQKIWLTTLMRRKSRALLIDAGGNYCSFGGVLSFGSHPNDDVFYKFGQLASIGVTSGLCYQTSESYWLDSEAEEKIISGYYVSRLFANVSYGVSNDFTIYELNTNNPPDQYGYVETESKFKTELKKFGWRFGWEAEYGFKNSRFSFLMGVEIYVPSYYIVTFEDTESAYKNPLIQASLGIAFGNNPWAK